MPTRGKKKAPFTFLGGPFVVQKRGGISLSSRSNEGGEKGGESASTPNKRGPLLVHPRRVWHAMWNRGEEKDAGVKGDPTQSASTRGLEAGRGKKKHARPNPHRAPHGDRRFHDRAQTAKEKKKRSAVFQRTLQHRPVPSRSVTWATPGEKRFWHFNTTRDGPPSMATAEGPYPYRCLAGKKEDSSVPKKRKKETRRDIPGGGGGRSSEALSGEEKKDGEKRTTRHLAVV